MHFTIRCSCGQCSDVSAGRAGTALRCICGRTLEVPPLTELQEAHALGEACPAQEYQAPVASTADEPDEMPREFFMILAPDHVIAQRINQEAFVHFVAAFDRTVKGFAGKTEPQPGVDLQIGYAMFPGGQRLIDLQIRPDALPPHIVTELKLELESLRQPPVEGGPVSFCCRAMLWGGATGPHAAFQFPFSHQLGRRSASFDQLLTEAAGLAFPAAVAVRGENPKRGVLRGLASTLGRRLKTGPSRAPVSGGRPSAGLPLWDRLRNWLAGALTSAGQQPAAGASPSRPTAKLPEAPPSLDGPADPSGGYTVEELTSLIGRHPQHAVLYAMRAELFEQQQQYEQAIRDYTTCLTLRPEHAETYTRRAMAHCAAGSQEQGLKDLKQALRLDPNHVAALAGRGMIYLQLDAWEQALADFEAAIEHDRRNPSLQVHRGRTLIGRGDYPRAVEALTQALRLDPHHDAAYAWRALARRRGSPVPSDETIQAMLSDFDAALDIQPEHAGYRLYRAEVRLGAGDIRGAAADCDFILAREPQSGEAHALRGIARQRLGDSPGAIEDCDWAIECGAESADVHLARAFAHEDLGETEAALADCEAALDTNPQEVVAINLRGAIRLKQGDLEEAAEDFDAAIELEPEWALPFANRGNVCRARGDNQEAIGAYSRALELDAQMAFAYLNRALAWADEQEDDKAFADFAAALRLVPDLAGAYVERAWLRIRRQEFDEALADLNEAVRLQPELVPAYLQRGRVHLQQGHPDDALRDFDRVIELAPELAAAYSSRGSAWIQKGEHEKADADFQQAIACDPGQAEAFVIERLLLEASYFGRQEEYEEAISRATEAIELDDNCLPAYTIRAGAYWYSEQLVEAIDDYTQLIERNDEDDFHAHAGRGQVYAELGEFDLALADLDHAVALAAARNGGRGPTKTNLAYVFNGRALALAGLGRFDEAWQDFERSQRDAPGNAWCEYNRGLVFHRQGRASQAAACFQQALEKTDPPLSPAKRDRARGFLKRFGDVGHVTGGSGQVSS